MMYMEAQPRVVLVDDDALIISNLSRILNSCHYSLTTFLDPCTAVMFIDTHPVDLLITDYLMPKVCGMELLRRARCSDSNPATIMITGIMDAKQTREAFKLGVDDVLFKPIEPNDFLDSVRQQLESRRNRIYRSLKMSQLRSIVEAIIPEGGNENPATNVPSDAVEFREGQLVYSLDARVLFLSNEPVRLTTSERTILEALMQKRHDTVSHKELAKRLRGQALSKIEASDLVKQHIRRLRLKLERNPQHPEYLHTVHGDGYRLQFSPFTGQHEMPQS